jgi:phospholipase/carboxylesterase
MTRIPAMDSLSFTHRYEPALTEGRAPLLMLHGTGGDESDLIPLAKAVAPGRAALSPRGKVLENGMPRFFRRLAEGVFDEEDLRFRVDELADFISEARAAYGLPAPVAVGFSNGANIAAALMLLRPDVLAGGVLIRAMETLSAPPRADLSGRSALVISGASDPIIPLDNARRLVAALEQSGAEVRHEVLPAGHGLTQQDVQLAAGYLAEY